MKRCEMVELIKDQLIEYRLPPITFGKGSTPITIDMLVQLDKECSWQADHLLGIIEAQGILLFPETKV